MKLALALVAFAVAACSSTASEEDSRQDDPLRVLLLGDSISIGYTPYVREELAGEAVVVRPTLPNPNGTTRPENCEGTNKGVENLERWLALEGGDWDVIHFNFGLHDLKRVAPGTGKNSTDPRHPHQASPERYERQLGQIVDRLRITGARLVFATTTPVPEGDLRPYREPADAVEYNAVARRVMERAGVTVNDLWSFVEQSGEPWLNVADVHFTEAGYEALGNRVAGAVLAAARER
ncbi:MAG: SGNH/GDSL hydrolase family protein [Planctomycetota bacterium]